MSEDRVTFTPSPHFRWLVQVDYATDNGIATVDHHIEEIAELHQIIEQGPDWNAVQNIRIELNPARRSYKTTVEKARLL
jgi:hypothetical protein